jgi:hypothetical protein
MNNTMVREIRGAKINPKSLFKNDGAQNTRWRKLREQIQYKASPFGLLIFGKMSQVRQNYRKGPRYLASFDT